MQTHGLWTSAHCGGFNYLVAETRDDVERGKEWSFAAARGFLALTTLQSLLQDRLAVEGDLTSKALTSFGRNSQCPKTPLPLRIWSCSDSAGPCPFSAKILMTSMAHPASGIACELYSRPHSGEEEAREPRVDGAGRDFLGPTTWGGLSTSSPWRPIPFSPAEVSQVLVTQARPSESS